MNLNLNYTKLSWNFALTEDNAKKGKFVTLNVTHYAFSLIYSTTPVQASIYGVIRKRKLFSCDKEIAFETEVKAVT